MSDYPIYPHPTIEMYELAWLGRQAQIDPKAIVDTAIAEGIRDPEQLPDEWAESGIKVSWEIALGHLGIIKTVARRISKGFGHPTMEMDDLVSVGLDGVFNNAGKYFPYREQIMPVNFFALAARNSMQRYYDNTSTTVRVPAHVRPKLARIDKLRTHRDPLTGIGVSAERAFSTCGVTTEKERRALELARLLTRDIGSIDTGYSPGIPDPSDNRYSDFMESIYEVNYPDPIDDILTAHRNSGFLEILENCGIDDISLEIVKGTFGLVDEARTIEEVAQSVGISRDVAKAKLASALSKLRHPPEGKPALVETEWSYVSGIVYRIIE